MSPITLYPGGDDPVTPNLKLALKNMSLTTGNNFEILDAAFGTGIQVNGSVVNSPNFVNSASATFSVVGSNVSITAAGGAGISGAPAAGEVAYWNPDGSHITGDTGMNFFPGTNPSLAVGTSTKAGALEVLSGGGAAVYSRISSVAAGSPGTIQGFILPNRNGTAVVHPSNGVGATAMPTGALATNTSAATVTVVAVGVLATDVVLWSYSAAPGVPNPLLTITAYCTVNNVNFIQSNPTSATQTPVASTINWIVLNCG
jgi:hypothetical protein